MRSYIFDQPVNAEYAELPNWGSNIGDRLKPNNINFESLAVTVSEQNRERNVSAR